MSSLHLGVDALREAGVEPNAASSEELHADFWRWREAYPSEPYFVHFQTTDVHWPRKPVAPFAGLFVGPEVRERYYEWGRKLAQAAGLPGPTFPEPRSYSPEAFENTGINRLAFFDAVRGLYDETLAHNDHQLGRLVKRLKASGEWEHTLFIVAADHGNSHGLGLLDPMPERWGASWYSFTHRIPMIIVWPDRIPAGQRFSQPVSMIDMLPTILDLAGLPLPEVFQGQSLVPLLTGTVGWTPRPVVLDEFYVDQKTGEFSGWIQVIDNRWIAGLSVRPDPEPKKNDKEEPPEGQETPRVTLFDLWDNPHYGGSVHDKHPDLVAKYTELLEAQWQAHQALAQHFTRPQGAALTPEQLRTLRSLGYIQ